MAATLEDLFYDYCSKMNSPPDFTINFYRNNALVLNNIKSFSNSEELEMYVLLTCKYAEAIYHKHHYNEAIDIIEQKKVFIDSEIIRMHADHIASYNNLLFVKGMAIYKLKDYENSTTIFKTLVDNDPKNDLYKIWLRHSEHKQNEWLVNFVCLSSIALIILQFIFKKSLPLFTQNIMDISGLIAIVTVSIYEYSLKRSLRNKS